MTILATVKQAHSRPPIIASSGELGRVKAAFAALADAQWEVCHLPSAAGAMAAYAPLHDRLMEAEELIGAGRRGGIHASRYSGVEAEARRAHGSSLLPAILADIEACARLMDEAKS